MVGKLTLYQYFVLLTAVETIIITLTSRWQINNSVCYLVGDPHGLYRQSMEKSVTTSFPVQILHMYASIVQPDKVCIIASTDVGRFLSEYEDERFEM